MAILQRKDDVEQWISIVMYLFSLNPGCFIHIISHQTQPI